MLFLEFMINSIICRSRWK